MNGSAQLVYQIKDGLAAIGLEFSDNSFSENMLLKSRRYLSWIKATDHRPAIDALVGLYVRLTGVHDQLLAEQRTSDADLVEHLGDLLWSAIRADTLAGVNAASIMPGKGDDLVGAVQ